MCGKCDWEEYVETIKAALSDASVISDGPGQEFAESVERKLSGILQWVEANRHITDAQEDAVDNMAAGIAKWM